MRPWCWVVLALAIAGHGGMLASLHTRTLNPVFNDTWNRPGPGADFFAVYHAGRQIYTGRDPYLDDERPRITPEFAPFRYPPGVALTLGVAVAWARPWPMYAAWIVLLELILVANLVLLRRLVPDPRARTLVAAGWLLFTPYYVELWMGQYTFLAASLVFWAVLAFRVARGRLGAGLWSAAVVLKLFPLALVPALLRHRRWWSVATGLAALALALAWFLGRPADAELFFRLNFTEVDLPSFHAGNFGLQVLAYDALAAADAPLRPAAWRAVVPWLQLPLLALATLAMVRRPGADLRVSAAIALLLLPLVSKHVWEHHYVVALPALTLLVSAWHDRPARLAGLAAVYVLLWLPSPLALWQHGPPTWHPERAWTPLMRAVYHAPKPLATLGLVLFACADQLRARGRAA